MKNGTGLLKGALTQLGGDYLTGAVHDGLQNLIDLTYGTQAWCDSYAWGISSNNAVLGTLSVMGKTATKYLAGLDCDEEDARKQALEDQQWQRKCKNSIRLRTCRLSMTYLIFLVVSSKARRCLIRSVSQG